MKKKLIIILSALAVIVIASVTVLATYLSDVGGSRTKGDTVTFEVAEGEGLYSVLDELSAKDIIGSKLYFKIYLKLTGFNKNICYGSKTFQKGMSYKEILSVLTEYAYKASVSVAIPENANASVIGGILEKAGVCSRDAFLTAVNGNDYTCSFKDSIGTDKNIAYRLEGYLYPDTYMFYLNDDPVRVINVLLSQTEKLMTPERLAKAKEMGLSVHELFTFASVVEQEACGYYEMMPKIAAVFHNRFNGWGKDAMMQSCPTRDYPFNNEFYNTYEIKGLPIGPIGCVTDKAVDAVLNPDKSTKEYYFLSDTDGKFYFNDTYEGHNKTIAALRSKGKFQN